MDELVSVVIPTCRRAAYLESCLESVLAQTYSNIEIIVVDDNNPESNFRQETERIMSRYSNNLKIQYIKHSQNKNGAAARNTGIKMSKGKYLAFLDDDDCFFPSKIEEQLTFMKDAGINVKASYCLSEKHINGKKIFETSYRKSGNLQLDMFYFNGEINSSTILIEKNAAIDINGFKENFTRHQDVEFLINYFSKYEIICVPKVLVKLNVDSKENQLSPEKLKETKELLFNTYQEEILKYSPKDQKKIYSHFWFDLFKVNLGRREFAVAFHYLFKSRPSINMILKFFTHLFRKLREKKLSVIK